MTSEMTNAEYHSQPWLTTSGLKMILDCPAKYKARASKLTNAMRIGTAVHSCILEPDKPLPLVAPKRDRSSNADREWWAGWFAEHGAKIDTARGVLPAAEWLVEFEKQTGTNVVGTDEYESVKAMRDSVHSHPEASQLLTGGVAESTHSCDYNGVTLACRPDYLSDRIVDVKTCADASPRGFAKAVANFRYQLQQAVYQTVINETTGNRPFFSFIAVEPEPPYCVAVYELDFEAESNGYYLLDKAIELYRHCKANDHWPGYPGDGELSITIYDAEPIRLEDEHGEVIL